MSFLDYLDTLPISNRSLEEFEIDIQVERYAWNGTVLSKRFERFFETVKRFNFDEDVFIPAAKKRAQFGIKTPDALHFAIAEQHSCLEFWTNDDRLRNRSEIVIKIVKA